MNNKIDSKQTIDVPMMLAAQLDQLVKEYAAEHHEAPSNVRRAVEIAVLQRGIRDLSAELAPGANKRLCERMGWPVEEGPERV